MPCFTDPEQYEAQRKKDEAAYTKHLACRLLTYIFFEENENLKKEAYEHLSWYRSHLVEDIQYCKEQIECCSVRRDVFIRGDEKIYTPGRSVEDEICRLTNEIKEFQEDIQYREELLKKVSILHADNK